jgi:hypothetical protein
LAEGSGTIAGSGVGSVVRPGDAGSGGTASDGDGISSGFGGVTGSAFGGVVVDVPCCFVSPLWNNSLPLSNSPPAFCSIGPRLMTFGCVKP